MPMCLCAKRWYFLFCSVKSTLWKSKRMTWIDEPTRMNWTNKRIEIHCDSVERWTTKRRKKKQRIQSSSTEEINYSHFLRRFFCCTPLHFINHWNNWVMNFFFSTLEIAFVITAWNKCLILNQTLCTSLIILGSLFFLSFSDWCFES